MSALEWSDVPKIIVAITISLYLGLTGYLLIWNYLFTASGTI